MRGWTGQPSIRTNAADCALLKLVMITAVLSSLTMIAVPAVAPLARKSRVAVIVTAAHIQQALASYAASSGGNYPRTADIETWQDLVALVATSGGPLPKSAAQLGIQAMTYTSPDGATYTLRLTAAVPDGIRGNTLVLTPAGIIKE
jgi:hypothetical protein